MNLDLSAEDLLERLQAGKIYPLERVQRAMANFFTEKNLLRLRELTLTEVANFVDRKQRAESGEDAGHQPALGLVAVAISSRGPDAGALLRKTARLAANLNAPWFVVYVRTPSEAPAKIDSAVQRRHYGYPGDRAEDGRHGHRAEE